MLDIMFQTPDDRTITNVRVTKDTVEGSQPIIEHKKIEVKQLENSEDNPKEKLA